MTAISTHSGALPPTLDLPAGRWHGRIWVTDQPLADSRCYADCVTAFRGASWLWPVLIPPDSRLALTGEEWLDRSFAPPCVAEVAHRDPAALLDGWWLPECCSAACLQPFTAGFPGLARRTARRCDPLAEASDTGSLLAAVRSYRLGLVAVERPADVPAALGWTGAVNHTRDIAALSAVLRSWEQRFGAVLTVLGFDTLELSVAAPPITTSRALRLAAEHRAFCRDMFRAQPGTLRDVAASLVRSPVWRFWWD